MTLNEIPSVKEEEEGNDGPLSTVPSRPTRLLQRLFSPFGLDNVQYKTVFSLNYGHAHFI